MKKNSANKKVVHDDHLGCFGDFDLKDPICKRFCSLNLRCAIECYQNDQFEILEDTSSYDSIRFVF